MIGNHFSTGCVSDLPITNCELPFTNCNLRDVQKTEALAN
jgi:hypothetical protein